MKPTYRIRDWDAHFETAESRKLKGTRWVPMPTKQDGKGYRRIAQHGESVAIFCAWNLIVQVASKMPVRGTLSDADGPLDAEDLSVKTGFPAEIFSTALEFLSSEQIGWMQAENPKKKPRAARARQNPPENPETRESSSPEWKGTEQNGNEGNDQAPPFGGAGFLTALSEFEQHRKEKRHKVTPLSRKKMYAEFALWGEDKSTRALNLAITKGWTGVFDPDNRNGAKPASNGHRVGENLTPPRPEKPKTFDFYVSTFSSVLKREPRYNIAGDIDAIPDPGIRAQVSDWYQQREARTA
jgi:hypothetical protein